MKCKATYKDDHPDTVPTLSCGRDVYRGHLCYECWVEQEDRIDEYTERERAREEEAQDHRFLDFDAATL